MKKTFVPVVLIGFLMNIPISSIASALSPDNFKYCSPVRGPFDKGALYQMLLPEDVLERSADGIVDARILGPGNSEIPWVVIEESFPAESPDTYPLEITGYTHQPSSSTITMKLPEKHRAISVLDMDIPDRDFKKHVFISGSRDNKTWQSVGEDDIYDFSSQVDLKKTKVEFKRTDYRYFRLSLVETSPVEKNQNSIRLKYQGLDFSVNGAAPRDIRIHAIEGHTAVREERPSVYDEKVMTNFPAQVDKDGNTVIIFNTGLPVDRLMLDIADTYYYRTVMLYASDTGKDNSYQLLRRESIYRFPLSGERRETKTTVECRAARHAFYKLVIENRNNPPLGIKGITVSWIRKGLYFVALSNGGEYSLCFGNTALTRPDYDLARFITRATLPQQRYESRTLDRIQENAGYAPETPREKKARTEKILLTSVVVLLVIGMGFWLYSLMRKIGGKKQGGK